MSGQFTAGYLRLSVAELESRSRALRELLSPCVLCPRECLAERLNSGRGECGGGRLAKVSSHNLHFGEEPCLVAQGGSGTVFLGGCNLHCLFCQNYPISQLRHGVEVEPARLASMMLSLQREGAENLNFVTPTHYTAQLIAALILAREMGLRLPLVWNSGGYERVEAIRLLDGLVDIYLPDAKYSDDALALRLSDAKDYSLANRAVLTEMWRQVGPLQLNERGAAQRGLLVRHLVLPGQLENTHGVLEFLAGLDKQRHVAVSVMAQYFPAYRAVQDPELNRRVTREEWKQVSAWVHELGLTEGYLQQR